VKERDNGDDQIRGVKGRKTTRCGTSGDLGYSVGYSNKGHNVQHCVSSVRRFSAFLQEVNERFVCLLLGNSPASEFYVPTLWNTLVTYKIQTPEN